MNTLRRAVLKGVGGAGAVSVAVAAGILKPTTVYATDWNKAGFESKDLGGALGSIGATSACSSTGSGRRLPSSTLAATRRRPRRLSRRRSHRKWSKSTSIVWRAEE